MRSYPRRCTCWQHLPLCYTWGKLHFTGRYVMPRDLPLGNGKLLLNFDKNYNLRDIYWPHIGQVLHTAGDISHTGVWVDGRFAWLDAPEWRREMVYEMETLVTKVTLVHPVLQLQLIFHDCVDFTRAL